MHSDVINKNIICGKIDNFLDILHICNKYNLEEFLPIYVDQFRIGFIHKENLIFLKPFKKFFNINKHQISVVIPLRDSNKISDLFDDISNELTNLEVVQDMYGDEKYPIMISDNKKSHHICNIKRDAANFFGIRTYSVHLNGFLNKASVLYMWVSKRAKHRLAAEKLDHLVCGGQPFNITVWDNLLKEAREEADMQEEMLCKAKPVGMTSNCVQLDNKTLHRYTQIMFDLEVSENFIPKNVDGAIDHFELIPVSTFCNDPQKILDFKMGSFPVIISFLIRHGYIKSDIPMYFDLCSALTHGFHVE